MQNTKEIHVFLPVTLSLCCPLCHLQVLFLNWFFCCFEIYAYYVQARDYLASQVRIQIKILDREVKYSLANYKNNLSEHLVKQSVSQAEVYSKHSDLSLSFFDLQQCWKVT